MPEKRLTYIAAQVRYGSRMADVGTDHAYLPVRLVQEGICPYAIATDLREGPLARAARTVAQAGVGDRISLRLGDGLAPIEPGEVDDIVIAGMGGETVAAILQAAPFVRDPRYRLILQPMSKPEILRKWLLCSGFSLAAERSLEDGGHLYTVITAVYTGALPVTDPVQYYKGGLSAGTDAAYLNKVKERLCKQAAGLMQSGKTQEAAALRELAARI